VPTPSPAPTARVLIVGAMLILYLVWGSTYLGIAVAVDTIPPFIMAAFRFLLAGSVLLGWTLARERRSFSLPSLREVRDASIVGALLLGGGMGMVALGELTVPSGIAALLIAMMPLWVAVFGRVLLGERLPAIAVGGIVVGLAGVTFLVWPFGGGEGFDLAGIVAVLLSPIFWSLGSLFSAHRARQPSRPLLATSIQMLAGSATLAVLALLGGEWGAFRPQAISMDSLVAFVYLTFIGSLLAFTTYVWVLRKAPLPLIATYAYVNPVVAVILGAIILGEAVTPRTLVAGAIIVVAVAVIITARGRMRSPAGTGTPSPVPPTDRAAAEPTATDPAPGPDESFGRDGSSAREGASPASALGQHRP